MRWPRHLLGVLILIGSTGVSWPTLACECVKQPHFLEVWERSPLIVYGKIVEVISSQGPRAEPILEATLLVKEVRKGGARVDDPVRIVTSPGAKACGLPLEEGQHWLIAVDRQEGEFLFADNCNPISRPTTKPEVVRRLAPKEGEPYWDAVFALEAGELQKAQALFEQAVKQGPADQRDDSRQGVRRVRRLMALHEQGMGALERGQSAKGLAALAQIEKVPVPTLSTGHFQDEPLRKAVQKKARAQALAAMDAEDWPAAYRHARTLGEAGDPVEGHSIESLLEHRADTLYDQGVRAIRSRDRKTQAEGRRLLKSVVGMTSPESKLHRKAKDRLRPRGRRSRPDVPTPKIPKPGH